MHGNAWEWVEDCWTPNASEIHTDGSAFSGPGTCEMRVNRGGGWANGYNRLRSATRVRRVPTSYENHVGFRVALSLAQLTHYLVRRVLRCIAWRLTYI